jgi:hypothetical protein
MATVIDTLLVVLGLEAKQFKDGASQVDRDLDKVRKSSQQTAKDMELSGKRAAEFFIELRNQALLAAGVLTGGLGLKEFIGQTTAANRQVGNLSAAFNVNAEKLSEWMGVAKYGGGTAQGIASAIGSISKSVQDFQTTGTIGELLKLLMAEHIPFQTPEGKVRDVFDIYKDIADFLSKNKDKGLALNQFLGMDNDTLALAMKGSAAMQDLIDKYGQLVRITDEQRKSTQQLDNAENRLIDTSQHLGREALRIFGPTVAEQINKSTDVWTGTKPTPQGDFMGMLAAEFLGMLGDKQAQHELLMNELGIDDGWRPGELSRPSGAGRQDIKPIRGSSASNITLPAGTPTGNRANIAGMPTASAADRLRVLQDELAAASTPEDRSALLREIGLVQRTYASAVLGSVGGQGRAGVGNTTTVTIANQTINTQAKDAEGIARSLADSLTQFVAQANSGIAR